MTDAVETQAETTEETQAPGVGLSINDLVAVVRIIDVCSKRGAFEGGELTQVGMVRDRIAAFLDANVPKEEAPSEEGEPAAEEAAE